MRLKLGGVIDDDLDEQRLIGRREVADAARVLELPSIGSGAEPLGLVGDEHDLACGLGGYEVERLVVERDRGRAQFEGTPGAGRKGHHHNAEDKQRSDAGAVGPVPDVGGGSPQQDQGDHAEAQESTILATASGGQGDGHRG